MIRPSFLKLYDYQKGLSMSRSLNDKFHKLFLKYIDNFRNCNLNAKQNQLGSFHLFPASVGPLILLANCKSCDSRVTLLQCIEQRYESSKRPTIYYSALYWRAFIDKVVHLNFSSKLSSQISFTSLRNEA